MNFYAIRAIYLFELARTWRTLLQSIATPVISTSLYFVVFGSAWAARTLNSAEAASRRVMPRVSRAMESSVL